MSSSAGMGAIDRTYEAFSRVSFSACSFQQVRQSGGCFRVHELPCGPPYYKVIDPIWTPFSLVGTPAANFRAWLKMKRQSIAPLTFWLDFTVHAEASTAWSAAPQPGSMKFRAERSIPTTVLRSITNICIALVINEVCVGTTRAISMPA